MIKRGIAISVANVFSRIVNLYLFLFIANYFGANSFTDWFYFVYGITCFFVGICYYATESAMVSEWYDLHDRDITNFIKYVGGISFFFLLIVNVVSGMVGGLVIAPRLGIRVPLAGSGAFLVIMVLSIQPGIAYLSALFSSYHQYRQRYFLPTIHLSLRSIGVIAVLLMWPHKSLGYLALAFLVGELFRLVCLVPRDLHIRFAPAGLEKRYGKGFLHVYRNVGWMTLALACTVVNPLIDLAMVGPFASGSVSLVEYAGRLRGIPVLAMGGVLILLLGDWARQHHGDGHLLRWNSVRRAGYMTVIFCVPAVIVLLTTMEWWVPLIFRSPMFAAADIDMLKRLLLWYFPGVPFLAVALVLSRAILVLKQARLLAFVSLTAMVVNIVANMILLRVTGLHGVAMSTSTVDIFVFVCYFIFVRRMLMAS